MKDLILVAKVFVMNTENQILTLRRSKTDPHRPLSWDLPGGSVEYGEDPTVAVIREAEEEAGLSLKDATIFITKTSTTGNYAIRLLYYTRIKEMSVKLSFEHDQYKWVTREEFLMLDIPDTYKECVGFLPN